jgi:hypothetical protein
VSVIVVRVLADVPSMPWSDEAGHALGKRGHPSCHLLISRRVLGVWWRTKNCYDHKLSPLRLVMPSIAKQNDQGSDESKQY